MVFIIKLLECRHFLCWQGTPSSQYSNYNVTNLPSTIMYQTEGRFSPTVDILSKERRGILKKSMSVISAEAGQTCRHTFHNRWFFTTRHLTHPSEDTHTVSVIQTILLAFLNLPELRAQLLLISRSQGYLHYVILPWSRTQEKVHFILHSLARWFIKVIEVPFQAESYFVIAVWLSGERGEWKQTRMNLRSPFSTLILLAANDSPGLLVFILEGRICIFCMLGTLLSKVSGTVWALSPCQWSLITVFVL